MKKSIGISVLFITIGIALILVNMGYINISITEIIRTYWPVILIWMGVEKLIRDLQ